MENTITDNRKQRAKIIIGIIIALQLFSFFAMIKIGRLLVILSSRYSILRILTVHLISSIIGTIWIITLYGYNEKKIHRTISIYILISIILLISLLIFGRRVNGALRWIRLGPLSIQPSSFFLACYPYLNGTLLDKGKRKKSFIVFATAFFFIVIQPDFGSTFILCSIWIGQIIESNNLNYFWKHFIGLVFAFIGAIFLRGAHAIKRFKSILKKKKVIDQSFLALQAIKKSPLLPQNGGIYVPEMQNDYFFSSMTNTQGILVSIGILIVWCGLIIIMLRSIEQQPNKKYRNIMLGIVMSFGVQSFWHIFGNLNLVPPKGISFPFLSAGGSLLISNAISIGIFLCILKF